MKTIKSLYEKAKELLKSMNKSTKREISYAEFEKIESKKYQKMFLPENEQNFKSQHPYYCTSECNRK